MDDWKEALRQIIREEVNDAMSRYPIVISVQEPLTPTQMDYLTAQIKARLSHTVVAASGLDATKEAA